MGLTRWKWNKDRMTIGAPERSDAPAEGSTSTPDCIAEPVFGRRNIAIAASLFAVALLVLFAFQRAIHMPLFGVSDAPHYIYQAESFLHGRWDLDLKPTATDVVVVHGKDYIVYPPFPALLLMPFVALFGLRTSDIFLTAVTSAFSLPLLFLLFEQARFNGLTRRTWVGNSLLAILLYFGSINLFLSLGGTMWFQAQVTCFTFTVLALLAGLRGRYALAAALLGCAFFSRATVAFGFLFIFYLAWQGRDRCFERFVAALRAGKPDWGAVPWRRLAPAAAVTAAVALLFLVRNAIVFGAPFNSGYDILIHQHYPVVTTGAFNLRYIGPNLIANFFDFPRVTFLGPFDRHPTIDMLNGGDGLSVFFTTPLFLLLFWRNRSPSLTRAALWVVIGLVVVVVLLFHAAGWFTFGARYLYDAYPFASLLLAHGEARVDWRFVSLGVIGIAINVAGAAQFWAVHLAHM